MQLTDKQFKGLKIAIERYKNKEKYTVISGYAGSGKSTLIKFIISELGVPENQVSYVAYTGKAAQVLKEKGCPNAQTAHKLLYNAYPRENGKSFALYPKKSLFPYKIIVVDEVSMLPKELWNLLLSHPVYVIALGDPGQLPPIGEPVDILESPHVFLDEIMRQAQESEIIRLSMDIRNGESLKTFKGKEVNIVEAKELNTGMFNWADQIICGKNNTRRYINNIMREIKWGPDVPLTPVENDKIICLNNYWSEVNFRGECLVNGLIGYAKNPEVMESKYFNKIVNCSFVPEYYKEPYNLIEIGFLDLPLDYYLFTENEKFRDLYPTKRFPKGTKLFSFDYGYAITCWKSQGSEYSKVLLIEEDFPFKKDDHIKYLYTGITRAKDKITIIKK